MSRGGLLLSNGEIPPLYHFTAERFGRSISREGITKGCISVFSDTGHLIAIRKGWIWLTDDGSWNQSWNNTRRLVKYDRTAVRFTVNIPTSSLHNLSRARTVIEREFPNSLPLLDDWEGSEHWWLYNGRIFKSWLGDVHVKEPVC